MGENMTKAASKDNGHKEIYLATENTEILLTLIDTVFARPSLLSQAKDTGLIDDQLKTNSALQMEAAKLEFKVI